MQIIKSGTSGNPTSLQNLTYTYDAVGNVSTIVDSLAGPQTQTFGYDTLNRLTSAVGTGGANGTYNNTFSYDAATGNLKTKAGQTYTYDTVHAHAVASQTNGNNYQYDANGNMTRRVDGVDSYDLAYDAENHLLQVKKNSVVFATFTYDGNGQRVIAAVSGFLTRRFVGQYYEYRSSTNSAKYYFAGAQQVAMNDSGVLTYLLGDHLGSTSLTTNASGAVTSEIRYYPFGSTRYYTPSSLPTRYRYTGQYSYTPDFGLYYYGSRWYDPVLGRFTSADSIIPGGVQGLDRYAYANNNPLYYTDPDGHWAIPVAIIAVAVVALKVIDYGWTAYDIVQACSVYLDADSTPAVQQAAKETIAMAIAFEAIEPDELSPVAVPLDDIVRHGDEIGEFIYKKGPDTLENVTPRPGIDDTSLEKGGLSFWDSIESLQKNMGLKPKDKIITVDPKKIDGLNVTLDNNPPGHVSVKPNTLEELQEWASTRGTDVIHNYTQIVWDAIVNVTKWK